MNLDAARKHLATRLAILIREEHTGNPERIRRAQQDVEHAEEVLRVVTLREEGGWDGLNTART